jgi:hypothetical protein
MAGASGKIVVADSESGRARLSAESADVRFHVRI